MLKTEALLAVHIVECLDISNELLGENYHSDAYFNDAIALNHGFVALFNEKVVGFIIFNETKLANSKKMYQIQLQEPVGHIGSICVAPLFQKKGIANQLVTKTMTILQKKYKHIYTLAWEYNGIVNLKSILLKNGFQEVKQLKNIWKTACENQEFSCPVKINKCICSGILFKWELNDLSILGLPIAQNHDFPGLNSNESH